jgi:hypothetical protein
MSDTLEQTVQGGGAKPGFFNHMFNLKKGEKAEIYNVLQYSVLALLPLIVLIRINQNLWPKSSPDKGSIELLAEMSGEIILTCLIVFVIFRVIDYIPTFSGEPLKCINILTIITAVIIGLPWYDKDSNIANKAKELHRRINSNLPEFLSTTLDDQSDSKSKKKDKKIVVSQHQPSRADQPILPPPRVSSLQDPSPMGRYNMNPPMVPPAKESFENPPKNEVIDSPLAPAQPQLQAANEVLGSAFSSW